MLLRLMQLSAAAGGPAARSAPVATILPGDASAILAAVVISRSCLAPLLLMVQVRSYASQYPLLMFLCFHMSNHCHL